MTAADVPARKPSFGEAFRFWLKLGFISFGGPAGQIALMHEELVERRRWISEGRFLHALNFCMLLPGPEAQQLAIYAGWLLHGTLGGIVAGGLFVLPSAVILWALSFAYVTFGTLPVAAGVLAGLKLAVLAIVAAAAVRIGKKVIKNGLMAGLAYGAFLLIAVFNLPFPLIVFAAGLIGFFGARWCPRSFIALNVKAPDIADFTPNEIGEDAERERNASFPRTLKILLIGGLLWWLPVLTAGAWHGWKGSLFQQGLFFSKAAVVTFGGAYAVLPYVAQEAVWNFGWLAPGQMFDGLGLAETTPGPLIMVLQFVGFVGAWQHPGGLAPLTAATLGAALTTWVTFVPCFIWVFLGAPHIEQLRRLPALSAALSTITAAVVGVIASLAIRFGSEVLWVAQGKVEWLGLVLVGVGFVGLVRWKWGVIPVILAGIAVGLIRHFAGI